MSKLSVGPDQIDNIIFDFGGVLFDIDYGKPIQAFKDLGMMNFEEVYSQSKQDGLFDDLEVGRINKEEFINGLKPHFAGDVSGDQILEAWNVILLGIPTSRIDEVNRLSSAYRTFLLSNTNALHVAEFEKMIDEQMGLSHFRSAFERIYYSNEMGMRKPHTEIYDHLVEAHQLDKSRTLFIDDTIRHVEGARKAGLHAHHFIVGEDEVSELFRNW